MVVEMPPLRDRPEDILLLSNLFIEENNREHAKNIKGFTEEAKKLMMQYPLAWKREGTEECHRKGDDLNGPGVDYPGETSL